MLKFITHQFTVIQVTFENDKITVSQMKEQIRSFIVDTPKGVSSAPEWMLFINPLTLIFVILPSLTHLLQTGQLIISGSWEQTSIHH